MDKMREGVEICASCSGIKVRGLSFLVTLHFNFISPWHQGPHAGIHLEWPGTPFGHVRTLILSGANTDEGFSLRHRGTFTEVPSVQKPVLNSVTLPLDL